MASSIHANRWSQYLRDMFRVTRPGGWCQIVEMYFQVQSEYVEICPYFPFILGLEVRGNCAGTMRKMKGLSLFKEEHVPAHPISSSASKLM